jgi:hypothetical protein
MTRWRRARSVLGVAALAAGAATLDAAEGARGAPPDRLVEGELVRVDLDKRTLAVRPADAPAREVDVTVDAATVITASGRPVALDELKPLERVVVACDGASSPSCRALRVRAGPARHAVGSAATR